MRVAGDGPVRDDVAGWFARRTWQSAPWTAADLVAAKAGRTVSVVLPALNLSGLGSSSSQQTGAAAGRLRAATFGGGGFGGP